MLLRDRNDAARRLAERLRPHAGTRPLVLAVPRGAVPMARRIASALGGDLDVALVAKLRAPGASETAIGSVDEHGRVTLDRRARRLGYTDAYLERETADRLATLRERARRYRGQAPPRDPAGRTVILVDDGAATGATLAGAIELLRRQDPQRVVVAVPVAPRRVRRRLQRLADEVVCLYSPWLFLAVNQVYRHFPPVDDETVCRELHLATQQSPDRPG